MLGRARTGSVPTQGRLILPTTGRSATASVPGVSPDGGGQHRRDRDLGGARAGRVGVAEVAHGRGQRPGVAVRPVIGRPLIVSITVETVSEPVRAIPTTYVRPTSLGMRSFSSCAVSPSPRTR